MDILNQEERSRLMARIGSRNTKPEMRVRSLLHAMGFRFRLHRKDLPGSPDIVLPGRKTVIFVHGCFWHRHEGCKRTTVPATNREKWEAKFRENVERDRRQREELEKKGWRVLVIWECETKDPIMMSERLKTYLAAKEQAM